VVCLNIPPLSERPEDLPFLVQHILQNLNKKHNKQVETVSREAMQIIRHYPWPGNVRELENILERSLLFTQGKELTVLDLPTATPETSLPTWKDRKEQALAKVEQGYLEEALKQYSGDIKKIAEEMGISTRAVYGKLQKYGIKSTAYRDA
jgi:two-component system response regulator HydG